MRRSFLQLTAVAAWAGPSMLALAAPAARSFDVLKLPSIPSTKATSAAMLAIANAGDRLVAVGERGIVLLSDDGGAAWRQAQVPVSVTLTGVQFVSEKVGWAIGHLGVVLNTVDGGQHWTLQLDGQRAATLALQAERDAGVSRGVAQSFVEDGPDKPLLDLYFESTNVGWVVGAYNLALRTEDGGKSWQSVMNRLPNPKGQHLYAVKPVGGALYIVGEQGLLMRSLDQGQHFETVPSPSKGTYFGLVVGRQGELLLYGLRGRAFLSSDAASSWTEVDTGTRASISAGIALENGVLVLTSQAGELLISRDGGKTFKAAANRSGSPVTALLASRTGTLVAASLRGVGKLDLSAALS